MLENFLTNYSFIYIVNFFLAMIIIFLERKNPSATLAWLLTLLFIPGLGFFLYIMFSQNMARRKIFKLKVTESRIQEKLLNDQLKKLDEKSLIFNNQKNIVYKPIIRMHLLNSSAYFSQDNDVQIFSDGQNKFHDLLTEIEKARDHIHIMYYIFRKDSLGEKILEALKKKSEEGVQVRLLIDSVGSRELDEKYLDSFTNQNFKYAYFFKTKFKVINFKLNYRNHRKLAIIDGQIGYIGGFNLGNEYLGENDTFGYWRDTHLKIRGSAVHSIQIRFLLDWRNASKEDITIAKWFLPEPSIIGNTGVQIVSSGPDSKHEQIKQGYIKMINQAEKSIYIQTPYFIPDESIMEALRIAIASGVEVNLMIPNKPDHPFVYWATYSYAGELLRSGGKVFTYEQGFLHAKTIIVDEKIASVGTANFDVRSFKLNFEVNAFIYSEEIAQTLTQDFKNDAILSYELTRDAYYDRPTYIKFKESIARLLSPIL